MKGKGVYVVTAGDYSNYHIEKIFSSLTAARIYSLMDPDRCVEEYVMDDTEITTKKSFIKVTYDFKNRHVYEIQLASKSIKPKIKLNSWPRFSFEFTLDFGNERIRKNIMRYGKESGLIDKTAKDKFAEYLYECQTTAEEIIQKEEDRLSRKYNYPIATSSLHTPEDNNATVINEYVQKQLNNLLANDQPLPDLAGLQTIIAQARQEMKE